MVAVAEIPSGGGRSGGAGTGTRQPQSLRVLHWSALAVGVALAWGGFACSAHANPTGGVAIVGQANIATNGNQMLVTTQNGPGTSHSAINWQSFSIPAGNTTHFQQPNAVSTVINRVVTNTPSAIFGTLSSNGQLVLVNQSGIAVGAGAVVDTAGFTASSLRMSDADALAGRLRFGDSGLAGAGVAIGGSVLARTGDVVLLGTTVHTEPTALVQAPNGSTILAAGQQVDITGRGLEGITLQVQAPSDQAINLGTLKGGAVGVFAGTLKHSGQIHATTATLQGGKVVLKASGDAFVEGTGQILAKGTEGGSVDVLGNRLAVTDQAVIDVSGDQGGGRVRVGGDYQGKNPDVTNANFVYFGPQASIKADATGTGNGGRVILWADDTTRAHGAISARGGAQGGDGGFVETSGKQSLVVSGATVDTRAPFGKTGLWLLDPNNIDITTATLNVGGAPNFSSAGAGTLSVTDLLLALSSTAVSVTAIDNLTVSTPISYAGGNGLSLTAQNGSLSIGSAVSVNSSLALESTGGSMFLGANVSAGTGLLKLRAGGTISQSSGSITAGTMAVTSGGAVALNNANNVTTLAASVGSGGMSYKGASSLTVGTVGSVSGVTVGSGAINLESVGSLQISNVVNAGTGAVSLNSSGSFITQSAAPTAAISAGTLSVGGAGVTLNNNSNTASTLNIAASGTSPVSYWNSGSFALGTINLAGAALTLKSNNGSIAQSGGLSTGGGAVDIIAGTGNVTLNSSANDLNYLTVTSGGAVSVKNTTAISLGAVTSNSFQLKAGGNITQSGAINATAGGVDLESTAGSISSTAGITAAGGTVRLAVTSGITLTGPGISSDAAGTAVTLITTGGLLSASVPVTTSGAGGRWLAYVPSFTSNVFPAGWAFKQVNASYGATVLGTGNGVMVAAAPVLTVSPASISGSLSKVYDGNTSISLAGATLPTVSGGAIDGDVVSAAVVSGGSGTLDSRNVGSTKLVTASGMEVTGVTTSAGLGSKPVYGYQVPSASGNIGTVTQRPTATWNGGVGGSWSSSFNWDALPDGDNVATVVIPAGVGPIVFDGSVGTTSLQSLISDSPIVVSGGALQVGNTLRTAGFAQSGGSVIGLGTLKVNGAFNQTGGSIDMAAIDVTTPSGGIVFTNLKANAVSLAALNGSITQLGGVETAALTTKSTGGTVLNSSGNRIASFDASNTGAGNIELTNVGALSIQGITNTGGNIVVANTGGVTTVGAVAAPNGKVAVTANSPLTIGAGGVAAGGDIDLAATNQTSAGDMVLNGNVSSAGGAVRLAAANNLTQNGAVFGALGVTATAGGTVSLGALATAGVTPVSYQAGGRPVTAPPISVGAPPPTPPNPVTPAVPIATPDPVRPVDLPVPIGSFDPVKDAVVQTNLVTTFLDKFEVALLTTRDDKGLPGKPKSELVVEGEVCRP